MARLQAPVFGDAEPAFRYDSVADDGTTDPLRQTAAEESHSPMPDESYCRDAACCDDAACCGECFSFWEHRTTVWGEYLYLRPRGADVIYATPVDGAIAPSVPVGAQRTTAFGYDSGFRIGGAWAVDPCSSFTANYTWYQAETSDSVSLAGGTSFLRAETVHPNTVNVSADSLTARARYDFDMQALDINYKALLWGGDYHAVNYLFGLRYARVEQELGAVYSINGITTVDTNVDFNGFGPRFALEGEQLLGDNGFLVYSKGAVNLLAGSNSSNYLQTNNFAGVQAQTSLRETRLVTVPEFELGAGWQSSNGNFRFTAGYYLAAWFNMMTTPEYLSTVRDSPNSFDRQVKTLTLDGMSLRAEWRF